MAKQPKSEYEDSIDRARAEMSQGTYRLLQRTKETYFGVGLLLGAAITLLAFWAAKNG